MERRPIENVDSGPSRAAITQIRSITAKLAAQPFTCDRCGTVTAVRLCTGGERLRLLCARCRAAADTDRRAELQRVERRRHRR